MKKIMILIVMMHINAISLFARVPFLIQNAYYISVDIFSPSDYPTMFNIVLQNEDSLIVDKEDRLSFISGVLKNSFYVPRYWPSDVFDDYGDSAADIRTSFCNDMFDALEKMGKHISFKLSSGEFVKISCLRFYGVLIPYGREVKFSHGLDAENHPKVSNPLIPFAITKYEVVDILPILVKCG